jgi:diacylglycerol kinase (ATP)
MNRFLKSFVYAWNGIVVAFREEPNIKIHTVITIIVIAAGFYFNVTAAEWLALILCISVVVALELINTAIEDLVDLVTMERKPAAGKVKDIASGAVLLASVGAAVVGVIIFYKYIVSQFLF